jgi:hypothetical protein
LRSLRASLPLRPSHALHTLVALDALDTGIALVTFVTLDALGTGWSRFALGALLNDHVQHDRFTNDVNDDVRSDFPA